MPNDFGGGPVRAIAPNPLASMGYGSCPPPPAVEPPRSEPPSSVVVSKREDACPSPRSPDDVTIELCAAIRAAIDVHPSLEEAVLEQERLTREDWRTAEQRCRESLAAAVHRGEPELLASFDEAYLQRLEQERGPIDADTYAALELAIERGSSSDVIVDLGIPRPALIRVKRVWARRLVADAELRREVREAMTARRA